MRTSVAMLVTFLFSDIEGSTELLRRLGGEYPEVLARYEALVSEVCERHGGTVVDSQGDSLFVAFPGGGGLNAAGEAQRALAKEAWPDGIALEVRMGVHTGEAEPVNGRYAGLAVHRAARIGSAAHGGQVLVSATTKELADDLESPHAFRDLGVFPLKDFEQPVRLFQLSLDGLPSDFPSPRTGEAKPERSRRLLLAGAALAVLVTAAAAFSLLRLDDPVGLDALSASNSVGVIDPTTNTLVGEVPVGIRPTAITTGEGGVWVVNAGDSTVSKIDPETRAVVKTISIANVSDAVAAGEGGVWVLTSEPTLVDGNPFKLVEAVRLDPKEGVEVARVVVRDGPELALAEPGGIAIGLGSVWAGSLATLSQIDPATNGPRGVVPLDRTDELAVTDSAVWNLVVLIGSSTEGGPPSRLERIDPIARVLTSSALIAEGVAVAAGAGAVWVVSRTGLLIRIDATTNTVVETIPVGAGASGVAADENGVWVANGGETTVMRIDPATNKVVATIELGIRPDKIAVGEGAVWVTAY